MGYIEEYTFHREIAETGTVVNENETDGDS